MKQQELNESPSAFTKENSGSQGARRLEDGLKKCVFINNEAITICKIWFIVSIYNSLGAALKKKGEPKTSVKFCKKNCEKNYLLYRGIINQKIFLAKQMN